MTSSQQFAQKVRELIAASRSLTPATRKSIVDLLDEARKRIASQLIGMNPDSYSAAQLRILKQSVDQAMEDFANGAVRSVLSLEQQAARLGAQTALGPLASAGLEASSFGQVSQNTLSIAQGYTADLLTSISRTAAAEVNAALQRAFLGGQQIADIIRQVGKSIGGGDFSGIFSPIGKRAATIAVNEVLRVHSIAQQAQLEDLAGRHPGLGKQWKHINASLVPRISHEYADGQIVPVSDAFEVGGEELMYPRDPAGSPENTINCHCMMVPALSEEVLKPNQRAQDILRSVGISISAAA